MITETVGIRLVDGDMLNGTTPLALMIWVAEEIINYSNVELVWWGS